MRIGLLTAVFNDRPRDEAMDFAQEVGYQAVEIGAWTWSNQLDPKQVLAGQADRIKQMVDERDLVISAVTCHLNHLEPDAGER